jgi:hypothetical protein
MQRSSFFLSAILGLAVAGPLHAEDIVGGITNQLRDQGFEQIEVRQTLLGRTRIVAHSTEGQREIIVNPNNGEILRDFWQAAPGQSATSRLVDNRNSGNADRADSNGSDESGNAGSDDDDNDRSGSDDSDDDSDDDRDDDRDDDSDDSSDD